MGQARTALIRARGVGLAALAALAALPAAADPAAWRVRGANGAQLALLGSMHLLREADYPLPAVIDELFAGADTLVMELDLDDLSPAAQQSAVLTTAVLPAGTVLADVVSRDVYALAAAEAAQLGIDLKLLERFEPWLVAITMLDVGMRRFGYEAGRGVEQYLLGEARRTSKPIVGLETVEAQLAIFDALSPSAQEDLLEQTLGELDDAETAMASLTAAWREGQLEALTDQLLEDFARFPGLYEALVIERNTAWVTALEQRLQEGGSHLVVVGALHLVGRDSVVELLERRGHRVERIE